MIRHWVRYVKTLRKNITYRNAAREELRLLVFFFLSLFYFIICWLRLTTSNKRRCYVMATVNMHAQKLVKFGRVVSNIRERTDSQTDRQTDRHAHHNTPQPSQRRTNNSCSSLCVFRFWRVLGNSSTTNNIVG